MTLLRDTPRRVHVRAPGKVNVFFEVGAVHDDGYHDVASVYQAVSLYEDVWVSIAEEDTVTVTGDVDVSGVPLGASNLAVRAARLVVAAAGWETGIEIRIHKGVPVAGGMGGGSADAAATLVAVNELLAAGLSTADLHALGAQLGADVPFALRGGTAVGTGRGDRLATALTRGTFDWVLVPDAEGMSTPEAYAGLDARRTGVDIAPPLTTPAVDPAVLQALRAADPVALAAVIRNDLQTVAFERRPALEKLLVAGVAQGALAGIVSGSGPTVAFLTEDAAAAAALATSLASSGRQALAVHAPVPGARVVAVE